MGFDHFLRTGWRAGFLCEEKTSGKTSIVANTAKVTTTPAWVI